MPWIGEADLPNIPAIFRVMSLKPEALAAVKRLNEVLSFGNSSLSRIQEEAIATVVSVANHCRYGAMTHAGFLRRHSKNKEMAGHLLLDYTQAELSPADRQMLEFALRVTQEPDALSRADVQGLRDVGLEEGAILSIVLVTCLANFMDRLANSLGVDLPPGYRQGMDTSLRAPHGQQDWLTHPQGEEAAKDDPRGALGGPLREPERELPVAPPKVNQRQTPGEPVRAPRGGPADEPAGEPPVETSHDPIQGSASNTVGKSFGEPARRIRGKTAEETLDEAAAEIQEEPLEHSAGETAEGVLDETSVEPVEGGPAGHSRPRDSKAKRRMSQDEESALPRFIEECCSVFSGGASTARDLYIAYLRWCDENDHQPLRQLEFGMNLTQLGYRRQRRSRGRHWWMGISLTAEDDWEGSVV